MGLGGVRSDHHRNHPHGAGRLVALGLEGVMALESWRYMDPAKVLERMQSRARRSQMTQDQSDDVEALLDEWYGWAKAQREHLGYSRISPMFRQVDSSDVHNDGFDVDAKLHNITAEMVEACMSELDVIERASIELHMKNKVAAVHRLPRLGTIEQQHQKYLDAKERLFPILRRKGLVQ
jgi:hypothetical protein